MSKRNVEELKQKLIELTIQYIDSIGDCNKNTADIYHAIEVLRKNILTIQDRENKTANLNEFKEKQLYLSKRNAEYEIQEIIKRFFENNKDIIEAIGMHADIATYYSYASNITELIRNKITIDIKLK